MVLCVADCEMVFSGSWLCLHFVSGIWLKSNMAGRISLAGGAHPCQSRSLLFAAGFFFPSWERGGICISFFFFKVHCRVPLLSEGSLFWRWSALPLGRFETRVVGSIPRAGQSFFFLFLFPSHEIDVGTIRFGAKKLATGVFVNICQAGMIPEPRTVHVGRWRVWFGCCWGDGLGTWTDSARKVLSIGVFECWKMYCLWILPLGDGKRHFTVETCRPLRPGGGSGTARGQPIETVVWKFTINLNVDVWMARKGVSWWKKKLVRKRLGIIDDGMVLRFQWVRYPVKLHNALDHWMPWKLRENESFGGGGWKGSRVWSSGIAGFFLLSLIYIYIFFSIPSIDV